MAKKSAKSVTKKLSKKSSSKKFMKGGKQYEHVSSYVRRSR